MELFGISEFRNDLKILQNLQRKMIFILSCIKSEYSTSSYIKDLFQYFEEISISQHFTLYEAFLRIFVHLSIYFNHPETKDEEIFAKRQDIFFIILRELILKHSLKKSINQLTLFIIFKQNQHLLFFLYEEGIFNISFLITKISFLNKNLLILFHSEIKKFNPILYERLKEQFILKKKFLYPKDQLQEAYSIIEDEKGNITEILKQIHSQNQIAKIIRKDDVNCFIDFISHNDNFDLNSRIMPSFYENNPDITNKSFGISLLEYSMAFGSINIFRYLWLNKVEYSEISLLYSIIGNNYEIIHLVEEELEVIEKEIVEEIEEKSEKVYFNINYLKSIEYYHPEFIEYFFDPNNSTKIYNLPLSSIIKIFDKTTNIEILCEIFLNGKISQLSRSEEHRYLSSLNNHVSTFNIQNLQLSSFYFICYFLFQQPNIDINSKNHILIFQFMIHFYFSDQISH
ncbi:hypothetical protein TRFO_14965 [Tritrichomonas foetus]|uniref:DUF3447 domain-containing protein n=1 Tax=Tritrichomonas foetus TaxID=1144522 RepID=A0A1J4KTF0_9EUKA|nr:hypothetical protein TRFO_14965 [Tritrichomonas foetus]|eukprot:OHT14569.1 hypothetical protein TRFO_14965 [Tritrichomonas foetus]